MENPFAKFLQKPKNPHEHLSPEELLQASHEVTYDAVAASSLLQACRKRIQNAEANGNSEEAHSFSDILPVLSEVYVRARFSPTGEIQSIR